MLTFKIHPDRSSTVHEIRHDGQNKMTVVFKRKDGSLSAEYDYNVKPEIAHAISVAPRPGTAFRSMLKDQKIPMHHAKRMLGEKK